MSNSGDGLIHHDFTVEFLDPSQLKIDEVNERTLNTGSRTNFGDLEKSIKENGIEHPPQVRPTGGGDSYKVFAGQRRVLAAQAVGLIEIPVIVKDLGDMEALAASVNENNEHLKKDVNRKDRAKAIEKLEQKWSRERISKQFGVSPQTIGNWLEPTRNFWQNTAFDPDSEEDINTEYIADDLLAEFRRVVKKPELADRIARMVIEQRIPKKIVRSAIEPAEDPAQFMRELKEQREAHSAGDTQVRPRITLTGSDAEKLKIFAKDRGISKESAAKILLEEKLEEV